MYALGQKRKRYNNNSLHQYGEIQQKKIPMSHELSSISALKFHSQNENSDKENKVPCEKVAADSISVHRDLMMPPSSTLSIESPFLPRLANETTTTITNWKLQTEPLVSTTAKISAAKPEKPTSSPFLNLPQELLLTIISYIGQTSPTLLALAQLTRQHQTLMTRVGDAMLTRVQQNFRSLMPRLHENESNLSYFVRHAECYRDIREKARKLRYILEEKEFCHVMKDTTDEELQQTTTFIPQRNNHDQEQVCIDGGNNPGCSRGVALMNATMPCNYCPPSSSLRLYRNSNTITMDEIDLALELSMELLDDYSANISNDALSHKHHRRNFIRHISPTLENQILSLCGKSGGKIFKYTKKRMLLRKEGIPLDDEEVDDNEPTDEETHCLDTNYSFETNSTQRSDANVNKNHCIDEPPSFEILQQQQQQQGKCHYNYSSQASATITSTPFSPPTPPTPTKAKMRERRRDEERIDMARLIMRLVICRTFEMSREDKATPTSDSSKQTSTASISLSTTYENGEAQSRQN